MTAFRRILAATDFSPASEPALELAAALAKSGGGSLTIAHVYEEPSLPGLSFAHVSLFEEYEKKIREDASARLETVAERARADGLRVETLLLKGFADTALVEAAKERSADLIVMGTHGRRGVGRFFLGSVAARVIATAPCPVTTVRGPST